MKILLSLFLAVFLSACGGGGGSPGLVQGLALSTTAGSENFLPIGGSYQFKIFGGVSPYRVQNGNFGVARAWVNGDFLTIGVVGGGTSEMLVVDFAGNSVSVKVTGGSSIAFYTTAPDTLTMAPGVSNAQTFFMGGGAPPYTAAGGNSSVVSIVQSGSSWTATPLAVGTATVRLRDSASATKDIAITVAATVPLAVYPSTVTVFLTDEVLANITGGVPPYRVLSGIPDAATITIENGNQVRVKLLRLVDPLDINIVDASGQSVKLTVKATLGTNALRITPAAVTTSENDSASIPLTVLGAAAGTVNVFSSDTKALQAAITGNAITVTTGTLTRCVAANKDVVITAIDSKGATGSAVITIVDNDGLAGC